MDGDFTTQVVRSPAPDLQRLPKIESVKAVRIHYRRPVQYAEGASRKETDAAIEFQVRTSEDFPIRALAPVLFVGNIAVTESERVGDRQYSFVAYGEPRFEENAQISVGWIGSGTPERQPSNFAFRLEGEETK